MQAALASSPLDLIRQTKRDDPDFAKWEAWGKDIITTAVFAILVTAPVGLLFINYFGDKWLACDAVGIKLCKSASDLPRLTGAIPLCLG